MTRRQCPICNLKLVEPAGPINAPILLLGEFPGHKEIMSGRPWIGPAGEILKYELSRAGIQYAQCRTTNLWMHAPVSASNPTFDREYDWHMKQAMKEIKGRSVVFMMGSDVGKRFIGQGWTDYLGLKVKRPSLFPKSVKVVVVSQNPAIAMHGVLGEIRFAIENLAELSRRYR